MTRTLSIDQESWPLKQPFIIARSTRNETHTIKVNITENGITGQGEAVASPHYGETDASVVTQILTMKPQIGQGISREQLQKRMPAGAARNAIDAALWDLEAKMAQTNVGVLSGLGWAEKISTVQTISILPVEEMGEQASLVSNFSLLKVKLNAEHILERIAAVHANAPRAKLIVDANESWTLDILQNVAPDLEKMGVVMIEQPLPAGQDNPLAEYKGPLPLYADESCHTCADLSKALGKYQGVNIKLDKTGGLTEAIRLFEQAQHYDIEVMVGCMLSTSLGILPATLLAQHARYVDIDAPALLARDREHGIHVKDGIASQINTTLWGGF